MRLSKLGAALSAVLLWLLAAAGTSVLAGPAEDAALNNYYMLKQKGDPQARKAIAKAARQFPNVLTIQLEWGYGALAVKDYVTGRAAFRAASEIAPRRVDIWKQLGYIEINLKNPKAAIDAFEHASALAPNDQNLLLQLAYLQDQIGRRRTATTLFRQVMYGSDREKARIGCQAFSNLRGLPNKLLPERWFGEFTATPEYLSKDNLGLLTSDLRIGQRYGSTTFIDVYGFGRINVDGKSGQTPFGPQNFTDNYLAMGGGIRVKPLADFPIVAFFEAGTAYDLLKQNRKRWREDMRAVVAYYDEWNTGLDCDSENFFGVRPIADLYADAAYYSRYDNLITTGRFRPGIRLFETDVTAIDVYGIAAVSWDVNDVIGNRFIEVGAGLAFRIYEPLRVVFRLEGVNKFVSATADYTYYRALVEFAVQF